MGNDLEGHGKSGGVSVIYYWVIADEQIYISEGIVGSSSLVDAQHIAIATVARVDVLASWNFKHTVNLQRIRGYNSVNLRHSYPLLEIRTPREVMSYGNE
jgi:hypothetical protein